MAHRTFKVEESDQPAAVLTHDIIEGTITAVDSTAKTIDVDLDFAYKSRNPTTTHWGRVQEQGYDGLPSTPSVEQLSDVPIIYNCESAVENPAGAFTTGIKVLIMAIGTDYYAVGFPDEVRTCLTSIYLRPTIDSKALAYGGQQFSVTYKKEGEVTWTDTDPKPIYGTWGTVDPKRHGVCGPFVLEDWDRGVVRVNLHKDRDVSAWRGNTVANKDNFWAAVVVAPVDGLDPPWGVGVDGETDVWNGQFSMFNYCIEDTGGTFFDYLMNNTGPPAGPTGELLPASTSCTGSLCPRTGTVLAQARVRVSVLSFDDSLPFPSFVGETNQVSTTRYRVAQRIYIEVDGQDIVDGLVTETVWDYDASEEIEAQVFARNYGYSLKQRKLIFKTWVYKASLFPPNLSTGYGRMNEITWRRITATSWSNTFQATFAILSFQAAGAAGWSVDVLSPSGCLSLYGLTWQGSVRTRDSFGNNQQTLTDFTGFPTLTLQQAMIKINDEGSPLTTSFPAAAVHHLTQPRDTPEVAPAGCISHAPLTHKYEASIIAMNDRWY